MEITAAMLKELREKTGAGIVDCKQTLLETGGDMDKAADILRKKGLSKAEKRSGNAAKEGIVLYKVENNKGLVLKVNCETDFVTKTDGFKKFAQDALELVFQKKYPFTTTLPEDLESLRKDVIAKVGENILVSEWKFIDIKGEAYPYTHLGKVSVIADFDVKGLDDATKEFLKQIAMQITAMNPLSVDIQSIPAKDLEKAKQQFMEEAQETGKPEKVLENIVKGKLEKYYSDVTLLEQIFMLDEENKTKVKTILEDFSKKKGSAVKVNGFIRVAL